MIRVLLFALLFAVPAAADDVFMNDTTSESNMCVIDVTGQTASTPNAVAHANWSPITYNCAAGTYLPADGIECATCTAGNYCIGGNYTYNETKTQGLTACAANYTSSAGASTCVPMTYNITYILNGGSSVPSTYTQLEYLESTGTQYIDTGIVGNQNTKVDIGFIITDGGLFWPFGSRIDAEHDAFAIWAYASTVGSEFRIGFDGTDGYKGEPVAVNTRYRVVHSKNQTYLNNSLVYTASGYSDFTTPSNLLLFATYNMQSGNGRIETGTKMRLFSFSLYNNDSLIQNLIPARRNSDNVLGMYDTVSGTFFTNDGTGTFVAGPDTDKYTYGVGATVNATPTRSHSSFAGWCTDSGLTNCAATQTIGTTATGDKTFYAKYLCDTGYSTNVSNTACNANTITVNWDNGAGGATQNTCTYGGDLTTPTTPPTKRGHVFTGWTFNVN